MTGDTRTPAGFTFVELLIATTMMSVLFVGLAGYLRGGIIVWRRTTAATDALQREQVGISRMEQDVADAFVYGTSEGAPTVTFGEHDLTVVTLQSLPDLGRRVRVVTYRCGEADGMQGVLRTSQSLGEVRAGIAPVPQVLLPDCETLTFRYAYQPSAGAVPLEWREQWLYPDELPRLIEVRVQRHSGRSVQRILDLPVGALKTIAAEAG